MAKIELNRLKQEKELRKATRSIKSMAHPLRLKILCALNTEQLPVHEVVSRVGSSQSNVSQHIDRLRREDIVDSVRVKNEVICKIKNPKVLDFIKEIKNTFCSR